MSRPLGLAMTVMFAAAVVAIASGIAYLTVTWSGSARRAMILVIGSSVLCFLTAGAASVLLAARSTYADPRARRRPPG